MRRTIIAWLACLLLFFVSCPALAQENEVNLILNGGFEEQRDGWPLDWQEDMWQTDFGTSYLELREEGHSGGYSAMVENAFTNDARFMQAVDVVPGEVYRLGGWVKAEGISLEKGGANISILDSYASFPTVYDTNGEWVYLSCYIRPENGQKSVRVAARIGMYGGDNVGKAWFDDIELVKVENVPASVDIIQLSDISNLQRFPVTTTETPGEGGTLNLALWCGAFVLLLAGLWMLRGFHVPKPRLIFWFVFAFAVLLRLYLMATQPGYETDMNCFYAWSNDMVLFGPGAFYESVGFCDYPPGYLLLLWVTGGLLKLFGIAGQSEVGHVIVKLMPMLCDMGTVYLLFRLSSKRFGEKAGLLLAGLYALSPAILVDSAVWGQVDSVMALGLVLTLWFAMDNRWRYALPAYVVTVLMKPQALMVGPIGLMALVFAFVESKDRKDLAKETLTGVAVSLAVAATILLPFLWTKPEPLAWLFNQYGSTLDSYQYATLHAFNLYYLIGANWSPLSSMIGPMTYGTLGMITTVIAVALPLVIYCFRRNRSNMPFMLALSFISIYMLGMKMHERYLFPALPLLLLGYVYRRDKRILALFAGFSVTLFLNCALVLVDIKLTPSYLMTTPFVGQALSLINLALLGVGIWVALDKRTLPLYERPAELALDGPVGADVIGEGAAVEGMPTAQNEAFLQRKPDKEASALARRVENLSGKTPPMFNLHAKDWALMLGLTLVYAVIAFVGLGSTKAPQTNWLSTGANEQIVFDLGETRSFKMLYYGGISPRNFTIETSTDLENWSTPQSTQLGPGDCFQWQYACPTQWSEHEQKDASTRMPIIFEARYVRLIPNGPSVSVMEVLFRDLEGSVLQVASVSSTGGRAENAYDPKLLCDEQDTLKGEPGYYNSAYFDEIYHARTGYEHAFGLNTYETTHPPLGKVLIMLGIKLFGMTPFGWRFMGALVGVLMIPLMYLLGRLLFKKKRFAFLAAFLMAFDMMHLTQTRIATIDSYAVFFIILMYLCMFRYLQMSFFRDGWRTLIPLSLSGLFMGLGCASKWTCIYAGVGLLALFIWSMARRFLEWNAGIAAGGEAAQKAQGYLKYLLGTLACCLACFIVIPALIYYLSYIPHFAAEGGLTFDRFWKIQEHMYNYHSTLVDDHDFKSPWWQWPLMLKPMYYYNGKPFIPSGAVSTIMCMGNPAIWWSGFAALCYVIWQWLSPYLHWKKPTDRRPAMLLIAFAAQFVPWMLVPRSMFIYHYFGSLPFVMLSIVYVFEKLYEKWPDKAKTVQTVYMGIIALLFIGFYPIATGVIVNYRWADVMNWFRFLRLPGSHYTGWLYY